MGLCEVHDIAGWYGELSENQCDPVSFLIS